MDILTLATSVIPDRSLGFTITVIVAGLGIVLGTLAVLIVVFYAFGAIMGATQKSKKNKEQKIVEDSKKKTIPAPVIPVKPAVPAVENGVSGEVVAAISAAVYEMEGAGAVVTSIAPVRKQNPITSRNPWATAAVLDNTKPF